MVAALLVLGSWVQMPPAAVPTDLVPLHVRVYADRGADRSTVEQAQDVARRLLASAGIGLVWRLCEPAAICDAETGPPGEITVIVSAKALTNAFENCGRAAAGTRAATGTVRVSVSCVAGFAARLAISGQWPVHPLQKLARYDDVLGAVVAHELGHVLGLRHAPGVMRARLDPADIVALRLGTLAFSASQSARMRVVLAEPKAETLAGAPGAADVR